MKDARAKGRWRTRSWPSFWVGLLLFVAACCAGLFFSARLLRLETNLAPADAIVLLGGDRLYRPSHALGLFRQGKAPRILISGDGDCLDVQTDLTRQGVPEDVIEVECGSRNTSENARFSIAMLRAKGAKRVILVTSWFHSRRALHCFQHYAPDIEWMSSPTVADLPKSQWPVKREWRWVLSEYPKNAVVLGSLRDIACLK